METQEKLGTKIRICRKELGFTSQEKFANYIEMDELPTTELKIRRRFLLRG